MAKQQKVRIPIPEGYTPSDRRRIADDVVQIIRDRTALGFGVKEGRGQYSRLYDFPEYTLEYEKKKGQKRVDLVLTEDMMDELSVLKVGADFVEVGYRPGKINGKVEGNIIGSYGRDPNPKKARNFLGVTKDEIEAILAPYIPTDGTPSGDQG